MAGREVNCEYCGVVVFEVDRWCVGCGAPRKAFPHEEEITYNNPSVSTTYGNNWVVACDTGISGMMMCSSESAMSFANIYTTR